MVDMCQMWKHETSIVTHNTSAGRLLFTGCGWTITINGMVDIDLLELPANHTLIMATGSQDGTELGRYEQCFGRHA